MQWEVTEPGLEDWDYIKGSALYQNFLRLIHSILDPKFKLVYNRVSQFQCYWYFEEDDSLL